MRTEASDCCGWPAICQHCGRPIHPVRDGLMWKDNYSQMVCPGIPHGGPHAPGVNADAGKGTTS